MFHATFFRFIGGAPFQSRMQWFVATTDTFNHAALWLLDFINVFLKLVCSNLCKFHAGCVCKCVTRVFLEEKKKA